MARTLEFDRKLALDEALVLFWRKGYQATSLADLLEAMAIGRSSFYAAFVDKRSLFVECLDLFAQRTQDIVTRGRVELSPLDALQRFFVRGFAGTRRAKPEWGCMLVNTVLEMKGVDDDLSARASTHMDEMHALFERCLLEANCPPDRAAALADWLMLINGGLRVTSRRPLAPERQLASITTTFDLLRRELA